MILEIAIAAVFLILILTISYALREFGLFHPIEVKSGPPPTRFSGEEIAFKLDRGPYQKSGHLFTTIHGELARLVSEEKVQLFPMLGLYFDDPTTTDAERCRYAVGFILTQEGVSSKENLKEELLELGYQIVRLPTIDYVVYSEFPYIASFSIFIAVKRVYPQIKEYIKDHRLCAHPCIEIYADSKIYFVLPLSKQDHFYLFDDEEEDEEGSEYSSDAESRSGSERSYGFGHQERRSSRSQSLPQSESNSRRNSTLTTETTVQPSDHSSGDDGQLSATKAKLPTSRQSSTASSFEELTAAEAATTNGSG